MSTTSDDSTATATTSDGPVTVVGAGLAGCEAAFQLAERGISVRLVEMKPHRRTPAHHSDHLAELVCSNSLRGEALTGAVGLLKEELRQAGSLVMATALATRVPAGGALAVDREQFGAQMTAAIEGHERIEVDRREVEGIPADRPLVLATGPLTSDSLTASIATAVGAEHLAYYDAIAPIVSADSIDRSVVWAQSRYDKGGADYLNCPFDETQYADFLEAVRGADQVEPRAFEKARYFEGCLPLEVMVERGEDSLRFGPLKPVGLTDPRTGKRAHAVLQLRPEDEAATAYNLVGCQTRMKRGAQQQVLHLIPGLEQAEIMRYGSVHRNTFIDAPALLDEAMELQALRNVFVAGQLAGVEGYVESTAAGLLCGVLLARRLAGQSPAPPPPTTALGGIVTQLGRTHAKLGYQPSNITWAHFPPLDQPGRKLKKRARYEKMAERALTDLEPWLATIGGPRAARTEPA
ncbi:MAG: methylenetetrahydrofolate--tRNA-(uracil(54)-C(5))-methyltransferase (FADH(2)-oxidizing) TrmFO [Deltaproteobacteria bacterium]|nr:methylenetetrahydrofolate--tRNA-(uracil(54)-C(5))-methyltransferase (FADH(2)-oxidizing) TrmFO [Deltaproteobacteria bacterium]